MKEKSMLPKTKKAAKEAGYLDEEAVYRKRFAPKRDAEPIIVKGGQFFRLDQCEELISRTEAGRRRLRIPDGAEIASWYRARIKDVKWVDYPAYRVSDCMPMRAPNRIIPACNIDLLKAIFTVNKSAKRYRDSAQRHYQNRLYGFAGCARETKERLYALKEKGIAEAYRQSRLSFIEVHGNMGLYRGEGYCFHSTLIPVSSEFVDQQQEPIFVGAAPKGTREGRLKDAIYTLETLADNEDNFHTLPRPALQKARGRLSHFHEDDSYENLYSERAKRTIGRTAMKSNVLSV